MVKPLAYKAAAAESSKRHAVKRGYFVQAAAAGMPSCSWWLGLSARDVFAEQAKREERRMSFSVFGKTKNLALARDTERGAATQES